MPIEIRMPALSPTMEEGTLAKWLVKAGDSVKSGDLLAEIETDKATMEFEAVDEGVIASIAVAEGTDGVKVGTVIATLDVEGEEASSPLPSGEGGEPKAKPGEGDGPEPQSPLPPAADAAPPAPSGSGEEVTAPPSDNRVKATPLARRIAAEKGVDLTALAGSGPNGRIVKVDVEGAEPGTAVPQASQPVAVAPEPVPAQAAPAPAPAAPAPAVPGAIWFDDSIPHGEEKLSNIRRTIARRLTEAKQTIPHIYLTLDVRLDALLKLRGELNAALEARGVKVSVNDLLVKALGVALLQVPRCNVTYAGDRLISYRRADVSVAVSTPSGLITPIIRDAANASVSGISTQMKDLAERARDNKLKPEEYQGGTASISNMGMYGIKQFDAVINPPQGMIMAVGAGEQRPHVIDGALGIATIMSATGSFDHRAIDGADGAELMTAFKALVEAPLALLA